MRLDAVTRRDFLRSALALSGLALAVPLSQACGAQGSQPPAPKAEATQPAPPKASATQAAPAQPAAPTSAPATAAAGKPGSAELRVATNAEPPTLDYHWTTASITQTMSWHIWEMLMTLDKDYKPQPGLADKMEPSPDGLTYQVELRKGVKFHNGKEMTSADVIASLNRWGQLSSVGRTVFAAVNDMAPAGDYALKINLKRPYASLPAALANWSQAAAIMPKEIVETAGTDNKVTEFIGTGPYRFVEWQPDRFVKLTRYDGYQSRPEPPNGLAGKREAIIKDLQFIPATDDAARVAGLKAGDYQFAMFVAADYHAELQGNSAIGLSITKPFQWFSLVFNTELPPFNDVKLRQAVQAAVNAEQVMQAAGGPPEFWRLDPAVMPFGVWYTDVGKELYSQNNPAKAKQLAEAAGYKGESLVYMTTRAYDFIFKTALTVTQQLKDAGFNIDMQVMDWATLVSNRSKTEGWNMFTTGIGMPPDPSLQPFMSCAARWPGFWCNKEVDTLFQEFQRTSDPAARQKTWEQIHKTFYEDVPIIKFGDYFVLQAFSSKLKGFVNFVDVFLWNTSLE
jgi:peptide/nickel transport system substrate-binding protein